MSCDARSTSCGSILVAVQMVEQVINNAAEHRYELTVDGATAIAIYRDDGERITFTHTEVPPALEGRGIGSRLIKGALADVRSRALHIRAHCSFVTSYLRKHPEEQDLEG